MLDEPGWSLYCIAAARAEAVFVHLPGSGDLADAAFIGVTQFREADRLLTIPIAGLSVLADLPQAMTAFDRDSQEGTALARDARRLSMTTEQVATFLERLARHGYPDPGYALPDIYSRGN